MHVNPSNTEATVNPSKKTKVAEITHSDEIKATRGVLIYQGKVNDVYETDKPGVLEIYSSDRASKNNGQETTIIPGKGKANNIISTAIFQELDRRGLLTHYLGPGSDEQSKLVVKAEPIPLEVIFRFETAGSFARDFNLPSGIPFEDVFVEFTYKSDKDGDPRISDWSIVKDRIVTAEQLQKIRNLTESIAKIAQKFFAECGARLIDGKVEYGFLPDGSIVLIDEISGDTVRIVDIKTGESLDKDRFRKNLRDYAYGYLEMQKRIEKHS